MSFSASTVGQSTVNVPVAVAAILVSVFTACLVAADDATPPVKNTQVEDIAPLSPAEALASVTAPPGFEVTLFAHEPDVRQPIAMAFDPRGRLWVAENYTYAESAVNYDLQQNDRILVLEDRDGDGRSDERKVFQDGLKRLTSVEVGFGGIWALAPPNLLFIPDRDGDDVPDGEPEVILDGWDANASRHNFVNGLRWGPDGWLYGRNGILATSLVGAPGSAADARTPVNCGIWRYHPTNRKLEVVSHGTTNPWGHDWNEHGQLFFINTVIGHLWHSIPGAHFRRMYGEDLNPHVYELIEQTADHVHWDVANEDWTALRTKAASPATDAAGGGHAHSGLMIYHGDSWPEQYRGQMFTLNFHGRRINQDSLEREGATYVGKHRPDLLRVGDPYFRGIDLAYGHDGGVYLLDWSDIGECHDNDGVHRTSGRIYKVQWHGERKVGRTMRESPVLPKLTMVDLAAQAVQGNEWTARQARKLLQERAAAGRPTAEAIEELQNVWTGNDAPVTHLLRSMWGLHAIGATSDSWLIERLDHPSEHVRLWGIQLLVDSRNPSDAAIASIQKRAREERSGLVLTYLASAMQRMPAAARFPIAKAIVVHDQFAEDRVLPLMVWYGLESAALTDPSATLGVVEVSRMPRVNKNVARRIVAEIETQPEAVAALVELLGKQQHAAQRGALLEGLAAGLDGWLKAPRPANWDMVAKRLDLDDDERTRELVRELSVVFGSGRALDELKAVVADKQQSPAVRRRAIRSLAQARPEGAEALIASQLADRDVVEEAVRSLAILGAANLPDLLLGRYAQLAQPGKAAVIEVLAARPAATTALLTAVEQGRINRDEIQAFQLRQIQLSGDATVQATIARLWPDLRLIAGDRLQQITNLRDQLNPASIASGDPAVGQKLFEQSCAKCHKLFGRGESIGPELTGAQRNNLNYWLENIVDPSATLAANFRMSLVLLDDGRVLNGVVVQQTERTLAVQTPTERLQIDRRTVEEIKPSDLSLMPNGLLDQLTQQQVRDLFSYLMSPADPQRGTAKPLGGGR